MAGTFITFEGPEGAGKSTQIKLLAAKLAALSRDVVVTREPGGTAIGEQIRAILLDRASHAMDPRTEALLLSAARAQHVHEVILPSLSRDSIVLCDRFVESTLAYQGGGRGLAMDSLIDVQEFAVGSLKPDIRLLLDLDVELGLKRRMGDVESVNRMDEENLAFHQRVRAEYLRMASEEPEGWSVINAARGVYEIAADVWVAVQNILSIHERGIK